MPRPLAAEQLCGWNTHERLSSRPSYVCPRTEMADFNPFLHVYEG